MEATIKLNLPDDFTMLCTIYNINPETLIQSFIDQVSFPVFYAKPTAKDRSATLFFINFLDQPAVNYVPNHDLDDKYLECFMDTLQEHLNRSADPEKTEQAGRGVMKKWEKAVLADRANYLLKNL